MIRLATRADIPELQRIRAAVRENRLVSVVIVADDYARYQDEPRRTWVAIADERVVGFAAGDRATANVWALFVDPPHEGRGHGRALHAALVAWMFEMLPAIWLATEPGTRAERFYRTAGWREAGHERSGEVRFELRR